jgi:hypothetical protein
MEESETKPDTLTVMCPSCSNLYEVPDPRAILLALHLSNHCDETQGLTHA